MQNDAHLAAVREGGSPTLRGRRPLTQPRARVQADFKDARYADMDSWFTGRKPEILAMNPLANLPYFVDGDKCVCQTNAVFLYIGDKYNLNGSTPEEKLMNTQLLDEIYDTRNAMIELVYPFKQASPSVLCGSVVARVPGHAYPQKRVAQV